MIAKIRAANPKVQVYICEPPPAFPGFWAISETVIEDEVCPAVARVAADNHTRLIDLHTPMLHDGKNFPDTVHPNAVQAKKLAAIVFRAITAKP